MFDGPIIDCDIHNSPVTPEEYLEYMPRAWRERLMVDGRMRSLVPPLVSSAQLPDGMTRRAETYPPDGGPPGSSYDLLREQLLEPFRVGAAILDHDIGHEAGLPDGELALVCVRALNDWMLERWLTDPRDERLFSLILAPVQNPADGVAEIHRLGANERFVGAMLPFNGLGKPFGHPVYHDVYAAMAEFDLPLYMHINGGEFFGVTANYGSGGGPAAYKVEQYQYEYQPTANHLASMIVHGVFEKFPDFKVLLSETGLSWLGGFAARLDSCYDLMRRESPWVKRRPSEYLRERLVVTTQPIEALPGQGRALLEDLSLIEGAEDMVSFASDYPHYDADDPTYAFSFFPESWHKKIAYENARRVLRFPSSFAATFDRPLAGQA